MMRHIACCTRPVALIICLFTFSAQADPLPPPGRPAPLSQDITLRGGADGNRKVNGAELRSGDCEALRLRTKSLEDARSDAYDYETLGEMYDRSICSPLNTKKAFEAFRKAGEAWGQDSHPLTAWKLWYGDGVERNRKEAMRQFRHWLIVWAVGAKPDGPEQIRPRVFRDRPMPPPFLEDLNWLASLVRDRERYMRWAARLYLGKARFRDGEKAVASPYQSKTAFYLNRSNEDRYRYAETLFDEADTEDGRSEARWILRDIADCGYLPAIVKLVDVYETSASERSYKLKDAYGWALVAKVLGADVNERLLDWRDRLSASDADLGHDSAERFLISLEDCE